MNNKIPWVAERPYTVLFEQQRSEIKLSFIVTIYNKAAFLPKVIQTIQQQTLGKDQIELIVIDDQSTDNGLQIVQEALPGFSNYQVIQMNENTGGPGIPRNIGISRANGEFLTFVDADDWFSLDGFETLVQLLELSGNDYAIGKTITKRDTDISVPGKYASIRTRVNVKVTDIPLIYRFLAPQSRIMRTTFLRKNGLIFPNLKFSEDTLFFMNVLRHAKTISTSDKTVTYLNRLGENNDSLTKNTDFLEKMQTKILALHYVLSLELDYVTKKQILSRIISLDFIERTMLRKSFLDPKNQAERIQIMGEVFAAEPEFGVPLSEIIPDRVSYLAYTYLKYRDLESVVKLVEWHFSEEKLEKFNPETGQYEWQTPAGMSNIPVPMKAIVNHVLSDDSKVVLSVTAFGEYDQVTGIELRSKVVDEKFVVVPPAYKQGHLSTYIINQSDIAASFAEDTKLTMTLVYDDFRRVRLDPNTIVGDTAYFTVNNRLGYRI